MKRIYLILTVIVALALLALALTGPDDVQAARDAQKDLAVAKADAARAVRHTRSVR